MEKNQNPIEVVPEQSLDTWFDEVEKTGENDTPKEKVEIDSLFDTPEVKEDAPKPQQKPVETIIEPKATNLYVDKVKLLIDRGYWQDGEIEIEDENGEKQTVSISDLEFTPELFEQIDESQKALKKEELDSKYVSVEGLDDTTKNMIALKKSGGDLRELIKLETEYVNPVKSLDLDNEKHQEYLVYQKLASQGLDEDVIEFKIAKLKKDLILDVEAEKIYKEVDSNFTNLVEQKKQEQLKLIEDRKEEDKVWRKTMSETLKTLDIKNETLVKNVLDKTSKLDEYGISEIDRLYYESKKNPELHAKLSLWLTDEKAFNEFLGVSIKNEIKKDTIKTIFKLSPKVASQQAVQKKTPGNELDEVFDK